MTADEWEVVDDDGFIYKRRKKQVAVPMAVPVECQDRVLPDQAQQRNGEALARRKKMAMLLAQKEMYGAEIAEWETLLSKQEEALACVPVPESLTGLEQGSLRSSVDATFMDDLEKLHLQVEAYEMFIGQLQTLHGEGERICKQLEMGLEEDRVHLEQDLLKDVTKCTPRTIIHSLTSEQAPLSTDLPEKSLSGHLRTESQ